MPRSLISGAQLPTVRDNQYSAPHDGHTLATVLPDLEKQIGVQLSRIVADDKGHNAPDRLKLKAEHRMGRSDLAHRSGDAANTVLAAVGYKFRLLVKWLRICLAQIILGLMGS